MSSFEEAFRQQQDAHSAQNRAEQSKTDWRFRASERAAPQVASLLREFANKLSGSVPPRPVCIGSVMQSNIFRRVKKVYSPPAYILSGFEQRHGQWSNEGHLVAPDGTLLRTTTRPKRGLEQSANVPDVQVVPVTTQTVYDGTVQIPYRLEFDGAGRAGRVQHDENGPDRFVPVEQFLAQRAHEILNGDTRYAWRPN